MQTLNKLFSSTAIIVFAAAMFVLVQHAAADSPEPVIDYLDSMYNGLSPYEKFCVTTAKPGRSLRRCLNAQPKTQYLKLERSQRTRFNTLNEIAWQVQTARDNDDDDPWATFCANTTHGGKANLCYIYCVEGIPCPYE